MKFLLSNAGIEAVHYNANNNLHLEELPTSLDQYSN